MKRLLLPVAGAALVFAAVNAEADVVNNAGGTISLTGSILQSSCTVDANDQTKPVVLGNYSTDTFKKTGDQTPDVPFTIKLTGCAKSAGNYGLRFDGTTVNNNPNLLSAGVGEALGVGVEFSGVGDKLITFNQAADEATWQPASNAAPGTPDTTTFNLKAHYKSFTDKVTAGDANATVKFVIAYK
ncbi:fimbrial protein [Erwinia piriflorinigrans]|uniref:Fimbrin-like protein fimI n=1 Tax=Erwinia piriflorinigrans CFBP 5888 TaxID=1161919 RepID=V5ZAV4_9GAMM|nr:fimbrial protein [Erwinia piriflorinigrans]CCG88398.1 Fimbrin-like protein fimI [Erwinia piriflorinigrans CFBP 5888]